MWNILEQLKFIGLAIQMPDMRHLQFCTLLLFLTHCDSLQRSRRNSVIPNANKLGPSFHLEPPDYYIFSNDTGGTIDCAAHGIPSPKVMWQTLSGLPLASSSDMKYHQMSSSFNPNLMQVLAHNNSLHFRPFGSHQFRQDIHQSSYRCVAVSESGKIISKRVKVKAILRSDLDVHIESSPVTSGNSAYLSCAISRMAREFSEIREWHMDGQLIAERGKTLRRGSARYLMLHSGDLLIFRVGMEDTKKSFRCLVFNQLNQEEILSSAQQIKIKEYDPNHLEPPKLLLQSTSSQHNNKRLLKVALGSSPIIPCFSNGSPPPLTSWFRESPHHLLEPLAKDVRYVQLGGGGGLQIKNVRQTDMGSYRCVSRNSAGETSTSFKLEVEKPDLSLALMPELQVANLGSEAQFLCSLRASAWSGSTGSAGKLEDDGWEVLPKEMRGQKIYWIKDGFPVKEERSRRVRILQSEKGVQLVIKDVQKEDSGVYQCFIELDPENKEGGDQHAHSGVELQAAAELRLGDASPKLHYTFIDQTVQPGPLISLKCSASGTPTPNIKWSLDGFDLPHNDRYMIGQYVTMHGDVISHLNITNTLTLDGGIYSCRASNRAGSVEHLARLNIYGPPYIREFPSPLKAIEGEDFQVQCPHSGYPIEEITWKKGHQLLSSGPQHKLFPNGTLIVLKVQKSRDEGSYSCQVRSRSGQRASESTMITVIVSPQILPFNLPATLQQGDRLSLTCSVFKGNTPLELTWTKDQLLLSLATPNSATSIRQIDDFTSILTIPSLGLEHNGEYTCQASNAAGEAQISQTVQVKVPPEIVPFFSPDGRDKASHVVHREGIRTRLLCGLARGDLPITFQWLKDGHSHIVGDSTTDPDLQITNVDAFSSLLTFVSLKSHHTGNYTCLAQNAAGMAAYTATLTVKVPPSWVLKPSDMERVVGERVEMSCQAEGSPEPSITWKKEIASRPGEFRELYPSSAFNLDDSTEWFWSKNGSLILMQAQADKSGRYLCQVSNGIGQSLHQVVNFSVKAPPNILRTVGDKTNIVTSSVGKASADLECKVMGDKPLSVTWTKGGINLLTTNARGRYSMKTLDWDQGIKSILTILNVEKLDEDVYVCQMENPYGTDSVDIQFVVQEPPEPPVDFQAIQIRSNSVNFAWKTADLKQKDEESAAMALPVTNYFIEVAPVIVPWSLLVRGEVSSKDIEVQKVKGQLDRTSVKGLSPYVEYKARISAENQLGKGKPGTEIRFRTLGSKPEGKPRGIRIKSVTSNSLVLTWEDPDSDTWNGPLVAYKIGWKEDKIKSDIGSYNWTEVERHDETDRKLQLRGLKAFTKYEILIQAINDFGSGPVELAKAKTESDVPEKAPEMLKCESLTSSSLKISWQKLMESELRGDLVQYNIFYQNVDKFVPDSEENRGKGVTKSSHFVFEGLGSNSNYSIFVNAVTRPGEGPIQEHPTFCSTKLSAPNPPSALKILPESDKSLVLTWLYPQDNQFQATHFTIYQRFRPSASSTKIETFPTNLPISLRFYEVKGLRSGVFYQFWITATNSLGEGPISTIVGHRMTQYKFRKDDPILLSLNETLFAEKTSRVRLNCKSFSEFKSAEKFENRIWMKNGIPLRLDTNRIYTLKDQLILKDLDPSTDAANFTCQIKTSSVTYRLIINEVPKAPGLDVLSVLSHSIILRLNLSDLMGKLKLPLLKCHIFYKQLYGAITKLTVPVLDAEHQLQIPNLQCGRPYQVYAQCSNILGDGDITKQISLKTKGEKPDIPHGVPFLTPSNNSVRLDLAHWNKASCPVSYFVVEYKKTQSLHWTLVSNNLQLTSTRFTIRQLEPETSYQLKVRANNDAGSAEKIYDFITTNSGERLGYGESHRHPDREGGYDDGDEVYVLVPIIIGLVFVLVAVILGFVYLRRKDLLRKGVYLQSEEQLHPPLHQVDSLNSSKMASLPPPDLQGHFFHAQSHNPSQIPMPEAIYSAPGPGMFQQQQEPEKLADTMGKIPQKAEDIYPYATFILPDPKQVERPGQQNDFAQTTMSTHGTVGHMGHMLSLHENATMLVSDSKSSASNPYTSVHRPKRRKKKRPQRKLPIEESDSDYVPGPRNNSKVNCQISSGNVDLSQWDPSPKKQRIPNQMFITANRIPPGNVRVFQPTSAGGTNDFESSSYSDEEENDDYPDQVQVHSSLGTVKKASSAAVMESPISEEERIFVKQDNGQFIALKASQIMFRQSHLAEISAANEKISKEKNNTLYEMTESD